MPKKKKPGGAKAGNDADSEDIIPLGLAIAIIALIILVLIAIAALFGIISIGVFDRASIQNYNSASKNAASDGDGLDAAFLNGVWVIDSPTGNNGTISIAFWDGSVSMVTEIEVAGADYRQLLETVYETKEFYKEQSGAVAEVAETEDGKSLLRITLDGTFTLTENEIIISSGQDMLTVLPFSDEGDCILIDNERYLRKSQFLPEK